MEYLAYLETFWAYFPYIVYIFAFLTFLPKSFCKIKSFAAADYEANRNKYHRCYAPDVCCHSLKGGPAPKLKARKAVTRVYPKRQQQQLQSVAATEHDIIAPTIKRQVQASAIQTHTHVNQIAKMFESGGNASKKINRVTPTIYFQDTDTKTTSSRFSQLLQEDIENSVNLLNTTNAEQQQQRNGRDVDVDGDGDECNWRTEPASTTQRRRSRPTTLMYGGGGGTSATPSTASPVESASPTHSSSSSPVPTSPVLLRNPELTLNMKSSLEDIFAAIARNAESNDNFIYSGCNTLSPVTSIDDILSQRRLSRPLSAYSISDLLNEETNSGLDETYVENFLRTLNKT